MLSTEHKSSQSPGTRNQGKEGKRVTWLSRKPLVRLKGKENCTGTGKVWGQFLAMQEWGAEGQSVDASTDKK